jgi:hypothetical protein
MSPLAGFFQALLRDGAVVLQDAPAPELMADAELVAVLQNAYADYCLDIAGPWLAFAQTTALAAAGVVQQACWALVSQALPVEELEKRVRMPGAPRGPAQHLSADLLLRFLPQVYCRARARDEADPLVQIVEKVLLQWPLSGVLADLEDGPETPPDFGGHRGLMLLYADRLARHERPAWFPAGEALGYVELVWSQLGKTAPLDGSARS